jgi:4-hydroxybenzoate polyprenyltransferase
MNARVLAALWKAAVPHWVWLGIPAWLGAVLLSLNGGTPDWGPLFLFVVAVVTIQALAEFANSYTDREEDQLYGPTNTLVTGELNSGTAKRVLILQNVVAACLLLSLLVVTRDYALILVMLVGWFFGIAYSIPPFRLKETIHAPLSHAIAFALLPIAGWLVIGSSLTATNGFILAFAGVLFLHSYGLGITLKFRKTLLAVESGLISPPRHGGGLYSVKTVGFGLRFRTAMNLEEITSLGAFILVPIFWALGIFDARMAIPLLAVPMPMTALAMSLRRVDPIKHSSKYKVLMTLSWGLIVVILLGLGLATYVHWSLAAVLCIAVLAGFPLLVRVVHPWGAKSMQASY